jgi:flavorubredoxin
MSVAVRYLSKSGNTKKVAEAFARVAGVEAISVDQEGAKITERVDTLFIGGALYAYGIDNVLKEYIAGIDASKVGRAVVFSTSWLSKHALDLIAKGLKEKGIEVVSETFYLKSKAVDSNIAAAEEFAKRVL